MKNVRLFYTKTGRMKFVSHLDMNRFMSRIIVKSKIPVWYTEGFNQRIYTNYAIPLSLGYEGKYEIMDIKITDDLFKLSDIINSLNSVSPDDIRFFDATEPILKMKDIAFSDYEIQFETEDKEFFNNLNKFLNQESIICQKTTKRGNIKEFDIIPKIKTYKIVESCFLITVTSGIEDNLNPSVIISAFYEKYGYKNIFYTVLRTMIYDSEMNSFK